MAFNSSLNAGGKVATTKNYVQSTPIFKSIGARLFITVLGGALIAVAGLSYGFYQKLEQSAEDEVASALKSQTDFTEIKLAKSAQHVSTMVASVRNLVNSGVKDPEVYKNLSFEFFKNRPELTQGFGYGQTPYSLAPNVKTFWPYFYLDQGKKEQLGKRLAAPYNTIFYSDVSEDNYLTQAYYNDPLKKKARVWFEPYVFYGITMFSILDPIQNDQGKVIGVVGMDVNVTSLTKEITGKSVYQGVGHFSIISPEGLIISYPPDPQKAIEIASYKKVPELAAVWEQVKQGKEGSLRSDNNLIYYRRLNSANWIFLATVPEVAITRPVLTTTLIGASTITALLAIIILLFVRNLNKRLQPILDECNRLAVADKNIQQDLQDADEIGRLSVSFFNLVEQQTEQLEQKASEARQSEMLAEISRVRDIKEMAEPLEIFLNEIRTYMKCDRLVVYSFNPDWTGGVTAESMISGFPSARGERFSDPCISQELIEGYKNGRIVPTNDVLNAGFHPDHLSLMERLQIKSNLVIPLFRAGELYGLLIAHHCAHKHEWQEGEITFLQQKALSLGQAFGGLGLLEQKAVAEQERARTEGLQRELINLLGDVEGAASGDLTVRAQITADEIGIVADFFNSIIESLRDVVTQVKLSAGQVNTSVGSNDEAIRQLAEEAIAQTAQITNTLKSVEEMTASIQQVAQNASQAADASQVAASTAEIGGLAMERTVSSILLLRETVSDTAKKVKHLGESSQQISKVVALISQIALKTNMLAVNASIEAARAGEEGRGFAVVAEEVGTLAAQSANATREIERIVENIQQETGEVLQAMESSTSQVVEGTKQVEEAKQSLGRILEVSRQVNELFQSISTATSSQVNTSEIVKALMEKVSATSQRSSSTSKEVSQSLQETVQITKQLQESVGTFKVN